MGRRRVIQLSVGIAAAAVRAVFVVPVALLPRAIEATSDDLARRPAWYEVSLDFGAVSWVIISEKPA